MPTPTKAWASKDGNLWPTPEAAAQRDLFNIFAEFTQDSEQASKIAGAIQANADLIIEALTTGPRSRPKARKAAGTSNPRRAAKRATPEQARAGIQAMRDAIESNHMEVASS